MTQLPTAHEETRYYVCDSRFSANAQTAGAAIVGSVAIPATQPRWVCVALGYQLIKQTPVSVD